MDLDEIKKILELMKEHELAELELEQEHVKLRLRKHTPPQWTSAGASMPPMAFAPPLPGAPAPGAGPATDGTPGPIDPNAAWGDVLDPVRVVEDGVLTEVTVLGRCGDVAERVWNAEVGYPGDGRYREFHKLHGLRGLRYWRVTDRTADLGAKLPYDPRWTAYLSDMPHTMGEPVREPKPLAKTGDAAFDAWRESNVTPQRQPGYAVVMLAATGRTRLLRCQPGTGKWDVLGR